jgi:(S)-ureidoglycine aminohydrolase
VPVNVCVSMICYLSCESETGMHNLPGFTRSVYERDHALIAPESRVYAPLVDWINTSAAHVVTPHMGAHFSMSLVTMGLEATADAPSSGVERFVFVLTGSLSVWPSEALQDTSTSTLQAGGFAYFPPSSDGSMATNTCQGATLIMYERRYVPLLGSQNRPQFQIGNTDDLALIPTVNEVFALRKLLPATDAYDFNVHIMDFEPGEYLNVKEMHYNQHGKAHHQHLNARVARPFLGYLRWASCPAVALGDEGARWCDIAMPCDAAW